MARRAATRRRPSRVAQTQTGLRIVNNPGPLDTEVIQADIAPRRRRRTTPSASAVDSRAPQGKRDRRHTDGLTVRQNSDALRKQKIANAPVQVPADDEMGYKKLFTRFEEAFQSRDIQAIGACLSPAFEWRMPNGDVAYGREAALAEMARRFAMPNGPEFSRSVWRFRGRTVIQTYRVSYRGPDGRLRKSRGLDLYKVRDGLITRKDAFWKMIP